MVILLWLGCQNLEVSEGNSSSSSTDVQDTPGEYVPPEEAEVEFADWDLDGIQESLNDIFEGVRTRHTTPILAGYASVMLQADSYCPQSYTVDGNSFWYGSCTSTSGMSYDGYLFYNTYEDHNFFGDGGSWNVESLSGSTQMIGVDDRLVHWGGSANLAEGTSVDGYPVYFSSVTGSFLDEGATETWLQEGHSDTLMMYGISFSETSPSNAFMISGSMQWNGAVTAVEFGEVIAYATAVGYPCWKEPMGSLAVRDAHGRWLDIQFDVDENWQLVGTCDGCGSASSNGEAIGEICVDVAPLLNWEGAPWVE